MNSLEINNAELSSEKIYDLNLSERYVPDWGAWEIGREIVSNAIDADPAGYSIEADDPDLIFVYSSTWPKLKEIKVIGCGSKKASGDTIGQFGEGFKLAALACCRGGGKLGIATPDYTAEFFLREEDDEKILSMKVTEPKSDLKNCRIWISFPGIDAAISGRFLKDSKIGPIAKREGTDERTRLYVKGVFMQEVKQKSVFDWNVRRASFGRDRNLVDLWTVSNEVTEWIDENITDALAERLLDADASFFEIEAMNKFSGNFSRKSRAYLVSALQRRAGTNIVLASANETTINKLAAAKGKNVLVLAEGMAKVIRRKDDSDDIGIPDSEQLIQNGTALRHLPNRPEWEDALSEIAAVIDLLEIPAEIYVFENFPNAELGLAVMRPDRQGCTVWLNERLFLAGHRRERMSTTIHELAHIRDKGQDGTLEFEKSLDTLAGILALAWIDREPR